MSACVAVQYADRIEIMADTAVTRYEFPYPLETIGPKIAVYPGFPLAFFSSGHVQTCSAVAIDLFGLAQICESGDEFTKLLPDTLVQLARRRIPDDQHGTVYMAVYGPSAGFELRMFDLTNFN